MADIQFECLSGGNVFNVLGMVYNKTVGLATITAIGLGAAPEVGIGATVRIRNLQVQYTGSARFAHQFKSATSGAVIAGGTYSHQFITCASNGVTIVGGSTVTPTGATYDPSNGNFEITLTGHSLSTSDQIIIADNAFTFTCVMDGSVSQKTYPRPGKDNAAGGTTLNITGTTTNTITVNVGPSPQVLYTPSAATYNENTGDMTLTIGVHNLTVGTAIKLANDSLVFRCSMDGYTTDHSYPRASDPYYDTAINITAVTANTITVNVGAASDNTTITGKFPAVHTQGTYQFNVLEQSPTPTLLFLTSVFLLQIISTFRLVLHSLVLQQPSILTKYPSLTLRFLLFLMQITSRLTLVSPQSTTHMLKVVH